MHSIWTNVWCPKQAGPDKMPSPDLRRVLPDIPHCLCYGPRKERGWLAQYTSHPCPSSSLKYIAGSEVSPGSKKFPIGNGPMREGSWVWVLQWCRENPSQQLCLPRSLQGSSLSHATRQTLAALEYSDQFIIICQNHFSPSLFPAENVILYKFML